MPATAADLNLRLSGGAANSSAAAALGGAASTSSNAPTGLMRSITAPERASGITLYRCIYLRNTSTSDNLTAGKLWIDADTTSPGTVIAIGLGTSAVGATEQTVASETTAPSGVTFSAPTTEAAGLVVPTLGPSQTKALWIRMVVSAGAAALAADNWSLRWASDSSAASSAPAVIQLSSNTQTWNATETKTITFASGLTAGSKIVVGFSARNFAGGATSPAPAIASISATGVTFGAAIFNPGYTNSPEGEVFFIGTVNSGGATAVSVTCATSCNITGAALEIAPSAGNEASLAAGYAGAATSVTFNVPTSGSLSNANALAVLVGYTNNYNQANMGWATPSGWTQVGVYNVGNGNIPSFHMAYKVLNSTAQFSVTHSTTQAAQYDRHSAVLVMNGT